MNLTLSQFSELCRGRLNGRDGVFNSFVLDSREVKPGSLFIAIKGSRVDGHDYVETALKAGAIAALVERAIPGNCIVVADLVEALAAFGRSIRMTFQGPVIGVTGSNGKTTTKEFLAASLSSLGQVLKSAGNRNTEYTSPLVWAELEPTHKSAVIEMAMRGFGQINHLASISRPTISVITMIGTAHAEKVGSREGIAQAKSEILSYEPEHAVFWHEDDFLGYLRAHCSPKTQVHTFGFRPDSDCFIMGYRALGWDRCQVLGKLDGVSFDATLPVVGRHQALNAASAILASHLAGVPVLDAAEGLANAQLPPMRMEVIHRGGATILLDNYNASPDSTVAAIKTLAELPCTGRRYAVIGEMLELGDFSESGHRLVGRALAEAPFDHVLLVGSEVRNTLDEGRRAGLPADKVDWLQDDNGSVPIAKIRLFLDHLSPGDVVLIKGSRSLGLEDALKPVGAKA